MLHPLHLLHLFPGAGGGLFAQHMLARPHGVDGDDGVHVVGRADGNGRDFGIGQHGVIIRHRRAAAVLFHGLLRALGNNIAEIFDFRIRIFHIRGNVRGVCNASTADDSYLHLFFLPIF